MRYFIQFSYFGKNYHGWQKQPNAITVQMVLEEALSKIMRNKVDLVAAGRTDAGVHAKQMYAHFDFDEIKDTADFIYRLNALLPEDIAVQKCETVQHDAHARFHALERSYEYHITKNKDPFLKDSAHYILQHLDLDKMNEASRILIGKKDFECFSKSNTDVYTYMCDVKAAFWKMEDDKLVFTITADRFLRNMVRAVVGTLLNVGTGKISVDHVNTILKSKDRGRAGVSVPAKGLYLTSITYPNTIFDNG
ncbi:tRNA pseudouridine(38-40) synthase TruA [Maribacter sp. R77961]|uniref:tRNA pseudouridine(38-40) synthase TruA n=1 Tax=Maribacter sp. R77961 TaxID=3093871 RepID=UPI0037C584A4